MAVKDSGEIATNSNYTLGDYSFRIERSSVPGSTNDKIEAICTDKDGKNARKSIQVPSSTQLDGWCVEANETEASVYARIETPDGAAVLDGEPTHFFTTYQSGQFEIYETASFGELPIGGSITFEGTTIETTPIIREPGYYRLVINGIQSLSRWYESDFPMVLTRKVFKKVSDGSYSSPAVVLRTRSFSGSLTQTYSAYNFRSCVLTYESVEKEILVARFAIDLEDAGGVGPGSDWDDPGDYDPDWEPDDPTHTLYVTVAGALSGRHNDPIEDPSYSYVPADKETLKDYGCGGDGGHGGGGGAGASTVVIHKFATNQANSKEVTAIARRHGYGSGGGKGGKGGDGCILVYY